MLGHLNIPSFHVRSQDPKTAAEIPRSWDKSQGVVTLEARRSEKGGRDIGYWGPDCCHGYDKNETIISLKPLYSTNFDEHLL